MTLLARIRADLAPDDEAGQAQLWNRLHMFLQGASSTLLGTNLLLLGAIIYALFTTHAAVVPWTLISITGSVALVAGFVEYASHYASSRLKRARRAVFEANRAARLAAREARTSRS